MKTSQVKGFSIQRLIYIYNLNPCIAPSESLKVSQVISNLSFSVILTVMKYFFILISAVVFTFTYSKFNVAQ